MAYPGSSHSGFGYSAAGYSGHGYGPMRRLHSGVPICVLISGLANILFGLAWTLMLCGAVLGIPMVVLAVFEFIYFAQANSKPTDDAANQARILGVLEIISGLFNGVSLICGILVLIFANSREG